MTYGGCSGQLGIAIKQWIAKFEAEKENILRAHEIRETCYSKYIQEMQQIKATNVPEIFRRMPKNNGNELAAKISAATNSGNSSPLTLTQRTVDGDFVLCDFS
jgi:hypothetical protein